MRARGSHEALSARALMKSSRDREQRRAPAAAARRLLLCGLACVASAAAKAAKTDDTGAATNGALLQGGCASFLPHGENKTTGVDYADPNISVVAASSHSASCCTACTDYNRNRTSGPRCLFAVWHKDTASCALKATGRRPRHGTHVAAVAPGPPPPPPLGAMKLIVLPNASSVDRGAVCLDGSPPAIYYRAANTAADPTAAHKFVLYIKGGGWCENATMCALRAGGLIGSSNTLTKHQPTFSYTGVLDPNAATNPDFANFHHVVLWYCDGGSFSGDRAEPVVVASGGRSLNQKVYYRGKRVLDAILDYMDVEFGLSSATEVLFSGGSAGGLSVYLHADAVRARFGETTKFRAAPVSGFFLMHSTVGGEPTYIEQLRNVFQMMNSSSGVNQNCLRAMAPTEQQWQCIFANASYAHATTPFFMLQSALDRWQMEHVFEMPPSCAAGDGTPADPQFGQCSFQQVAALNQWEADFLADLRRTPTFSLVQSGGFIESCLEHCAAQRNRGIDGIKNGGTSMRQALSAWWNDDGLERARLGGGDASKPSKHWHLPCSLTDAAPHQCNPTCSEKDE